MKNETNRPGEPFDERTNEDSYFAVHEHELVERMKSEHQRADATKRQALMATCPKCLAIWRSTQSRALLSNVVKVVKGSGSIRANSVRFCAAKREGR